MNLISAQDMWGFLKVYTWRKRYKRSQKRKHTTHVEYLRNVLLDVTSQIWYSTKPCIGPSLAVCLVRGTEDDAQTFYKEVEKTIEGLRWLGYEVTATWDSDARYVVHITVPES